MLKGVIFDFDGTLIDTKESIIQGFDYVFKKYRPDYPTSREFYISLLGPALYQLFPLYFKENCQQIIDDYRLGCEPYMNSKYIHLFEGVIDTIDKLKSLGIKIIILTSRARKSTVKLLKEFNLLSRCDYFVCSDDVKKCKPDPEGIFNILNHYNFSNKDVCMVGDHSGDIKVGKASNVLSIGVGWSTRGKDVLIKDGADIILDRIEDILEIVKR